MPIIRIHSDIPTSLLRPVEKAVGKKTGGEVIARQGTNGGRLCMFQGKIAWVICNSFPYRLQDVLYNQANLTKQDIAAALVECKRTGLNLAQILLDWELADHATLSHCLLLHNTKHFYAIAAMGPNLTVSFTPQAIQYTSEFLYSLEDITSTKLAITK